MIDVGDDLGNAWPAHRRVDRREHGLDLQVAERPLGVGGVVSEPGEVVVDHVPHRSVTQGVQ
jgi:hypothetical protein